MASAILTLLGLWSSFSFTSCLDNGLAVTPPMGWLSWERFRCETNCETFPDTCISESLLKTMADEMVTGGYLQAGYQYLCVDDCWLADTRDSQGSLQPDPQRFPSGIKALADYVHSKGLKFEIYEDFGTLTCGGFPGSEFYLQQDAQTFADWGVDLLKLDGCYSDVADFDPGYSAMSFFLNQTGRPILFSCDEPEYLVRKELSPDFATLKKICNQWRNYYDIDDSWYSVYSIIDFFGKDSGNFSSFAGPGSWNDPDMLIIGDFGLSHDQERTQMAMWAMFAAPLLMSNDLRDIRNSSKAILLNKNVIAVNQDPMGKAGRRIFKNSDGVEVWTRPIMPSGSMAVVALFNSDQGRQGVLNILGTQLGLTNPQGYKLVETFDGVAMGNLMPSQTLILTINPTGVVMFTAIPLS